MAQALLYLPFLLQGAAIAIDEFYFHYRRGLARWERLSHPVDSFLTFACYFFLVLAPVSATSLFVYVGLCTLSCLLVTKDEWVHAKECHGGELWLHSILFMLHPLAFAASFTLWWNHQSLFFVKAQVAVVFLFLVYQLFYWLIFLREKKYETHQ